MDEPFYSVRDLSKDPRPRRCRAAGRGSCSHYATGPGPVGSLRPYSVPPGTRGPNEPGPGAAGQQYTALTPRRAAPQIPGKAATPTTKTLPRAHSQEEGSTP